MRRRSVFLLSSRLALIATLCYVSFLVSTDSALAQGAPRSGGNTTGGRPSGGSGTTPSSANPGSSPVSPPDRPKTNPIPIPSTSPAPYSPPVIIVKPEPYTTPYVPPYVAPAYNPAYPFTSLPVPNAPVNIYVPSLQAQQGNSVSGVIDKPVGRPIAADNAVFSQIIQQKGNITRYMIVDPQAHTVSIIRVKLPVEVDGVAEVVCESVASYGSGKKP
ncbi:MAG: hypothetical protein WCP07_02560 [bacterium]